MYILASLCRLRQLFYAKSTSEDNVVLRGDVLSYVVHIAYVCVKVVTKENGETNTLFLIVGQMGMLKVFGIYHKNNSSLSIDLLDNFHDII